MWSALRNGSGPHGATAGGYVPSQGWEFVPCSRLEKAERSNEKNRSPQRRISSPPAVSRHTDEAHCDALTAEGEGRTKMESVKGQMPPSPEGHQHHARLKKKFEDLKKRHVQNKEEWRLEKESLLREVADIQGGENRRILLDMKTVLEEVQVEVKREEEKRSDLQTLYTKDRCAWELERAELKSRIAQLETKDGSRSASGGVQCAGSSNLVAQPSGCEENSQTSTLRKDKEEQRRLLADTHSTTMELRCRLEHNEKDWLKEKAELLERFNIERSEWESQLKDMQRKIEELYCEVRAKREGAGGRQKEEEIHRLSVPSLSSASSMLSDMSQTHSSCSQSEFLPAFDHYVISGEGRETHTPGYQPDNFKRLIAGSQFSRNESAHPALTLKDSILDRNNIENNTELEANLQKPIGCGLGRKQPLIENENLHCDIQRNPVLEAEKKKSTIALNAALKEIARVSEELCSYQDEIKQKSDEKRNHSESGEINTPDDMDKTGQQSEKTSHDLSQIYNQLKALEKENWITLTPDYTWRANGGSKDSWEKNDINTHDDTQASTVSLLDTDAACPPIPPRSFSRNLSSPCQTDMELYIPESPMTTIRKCHSPYVTEDKTSFSPSVVRKFEAMLQENEGKVLVDGVVSPLSVPQSLNSNNGCCHNRWSCDASKFTSSKLSKSGTVQKSFSEANILTSTKDCSPFSSGTGNSPHPQIHIPPAVKEMPVDLLLSSLEIASTIPDVQASRRNIMLELKTAEFNRTLFQAEMGKGVPEPERVTEEGGSSVGKQQALVADSLPDERLPSWPEPDDNTDEREVYINDASSTPTLPFTIQNKEIKMTLNSSESQVAKMKKSTSSVNVPEQINASTWKVSTVHSQSPTCISAVTSSISRKTPNRTHTGSEPALSAITHQCQRVQDLNSMMGNPFEPVRVQVSLQQTSSQSKQGHPKLPKLGSLPSSQNGCSRPVPRTLNDHPWKPLTLAAYPRPEGSRSNYGALERILKHYESAAQSQPQDETASSPNQSNIQSNHSDVSNLVVQIQQPLQVQEDFRWKT
ncbi:uncharacterized protein LOC144199525 isoform X2 [Stigmatopora nigra]